MIKWFKRVFVLATVFLGLYYFGDFQINGTNVRGYLQSVIPPQKMTAARLWMWDHIQWAYYRVANEFGLSAGKSPEVITDQDREKLIRLLEENLGSDLAQKIENHGRDVSKTFESITEEDRQKLLQLLQSQLSGSALPENQNKRLEESVRQAESILDDKNRR